ncbi:MAG: hypothetical protein JXA96_03215 [Sedimentisphaerales bacterium]|nr:hypothetical protein [Sedimentisphaerales bacterium]
MERSKGLILIVVGLAAALIVYQVGFSKKSEPTSTTQKQEDNSETQRQTRQQRQQATSGNTSEQPTAQNGRFAANNPQGQDTTAVNPTDRTLGRGNNNRDRTTQTNLQSTGLKISIPEDITKNQLQVIYAEYRQLSGGRNAGRGGRNTGRGGMTGGFGGGMNMGGMMGGGYDMTEMMGGMDMEEMMNMGGFGGMMGNRGGFGGMDMQEINIDENEDIQY